MASLTVVTLNTRGLNDPVKCQTVFDQLHGGIGDIFLLQECSIPYKDNYGLYEKRWTHGESIWSGTNKNRSAGVAILLRGQSFCIQRVQRVIDGRILCVDIDFNGAKFRIINIYCPSELQERLETLQVLQPLIFCGWEVIIGGDFNCIIDKKDRLSTSVTNVRLDSSSYALSDLIKDYNLTDTFTCKNSPTPGFTWTNGRTFSRIDFLLTSSGVIPLNCLVTPVPFSDHSKLTCSINIPGTFRPCPSHWKLNTSLLENHNVVSKFKAKLEQWKSLRFMYESVGDWWEDTKQRSKSFFMMEGKRAAAKRRAFQARLQGRLQRLYLLALSGFHVEEDIANFKKEMTKLVNEKSKGLLTQSRVQHLEENEKCTRYFFRKLAKSKHVLQSVLDQEGREVRDTQQIPNIVRSFFSNLYQERQFSEDKVLFFLSQLTNKLDNTTRDLLEGDLTTAELTKAMQSMENNKTPGVDGLPKEFYATFWDQLKEPLLEVFKESFITGTLPPSLRKGSISLLFKRGPKEDLRNWRPLTMLGVDAKILSKALFFRIQPIVNNIVHFDQTCGIPGRSMSDSLALVRDCYLYCQERSLPLCILGLDLEKAFDSISHQYLKAVLTHMNFGQVVRQWVDLLYRDCNSVVVVNGKHTQPFDILSGVRQGCALSPILFILAIEPLACALRNNRNIKGISVPGGMGVQAKLSLYMDDLTLLLSDNKSVRETLALCEDFTLASGTKVNKNKSETLLLNWQEPMEELGLLERKNTIKVLGVQIGKNMETCNWNSRLPKLTGKLMQWQERELSFTGKILVVKAEVLSSITQLAALFPIPQKDLVSLRKNIFHFIWGSQHEKLKRDIMYRPVGKGGKAVPEIEVKLKAMFLSPILKACLSTGKGPTWNYFAKLWVGLKVLTAWGKRPSLSVPHADSCPSIYNTVIQTLKNGLSVIPPEKISRTNIEKVLSPQSSRLAPVGALTEERCKRVWANVNNSMLTNIHKDLAWQIAHQCLPTRAFLEQRHCARSPKCPRPTCGDDESVPHLFWSCPFAKDVWLLVLPWLRDLYRAPLTYDDIAYGFVKDIPSENVNRWWVVINCVKESLWKARNIWVFKKYAVPKENVIQSMLSIFRDYILKDKSCKGVKQKLQLWKVPVDYRCKLT